MAIRFYSQSDTHREFSNFAPFPIVIDGVRWPTTEHYYQAQKFTDPALQQAIRKAPVPAAAKSIADKNKAAIREGWDALKDAVMERAIRSKFAQHNALRALLLATGEEDILEAAPTDYYWGVGRTGTGENRLGKMLMRLRDEMRGREPGTEPR